MSTLFAGLDWASQTHAACVIDERGALPGSAAFATGRPLSVGWNEKSVI